MSDSSLRVSRQELFVLRKALSERDRQILEHVSALRLLAARQIQALHFPDASHATPTTAARCCRRVLERLTGRQLLVRLERRVGGVRAGSASFVYAISSLGQRVLDQTGPRRRLREPSARFVDHTLAIADVFVQITIHARRDRWELLDWQAEPICWRNVTTLGGRLVLRPDLYVVLATAEYELRWFIEVDRASEHAPALTRKCRLYHSYYKGGGEQRRHKVFPRVLWITINEERGQQLQSLIAADRRLTADLFRITTEDGAMAAIGEMS